MASITAPTGVQEATSNPSEKDSKLSEKNAKVSEKTDADIEGQHQIPSCSRITPQNGTANGRLSAFKALGFLDRFLALWIFLAMLIGILLGNFVDDVGPALKRGSFVGVSLPIAIGLLIMMYPILCKVQYETLHLVFRRRQIYIQLAFSLALNWILAPLLMLALAWAFLPDEPSLRQGLILVGVARCIAMVLVWNALAGGHADYCAILVAVNSLLQIVLFAPLSLLFLKVMAPDSDPGVRGITYSTVATSVAAFLGIPLAAAMLTRLVLLRISPRFFHGTFLRFAAPWSLIGLLFTILVLFASQGKQVVHQVVSVVRVAAPLVVYFGVVFAATLLVAMRLGFRYDFAVTQSFTAASNNFELAIAVAVAAFGADSDQALAATVGPLVEVPVLLGLVYGVGWFTRWRGWDTKGGEEEEGEGEGEGEGERRGEGGGGAGEKV